VGSLRAALADAGAYVSKGQHAIVMDLGAGPATIALTEALPLPAARNITVDGALSGGARVTVTGARASKGLLKQTLGTRENGVTVAFQNVDFVEIGFEVSANALALTNASLTSTRPRIPGGSDDDHLRGVVSTDTARVVLRRVRLDGFRLSRAYWGAALVVEGRATLDATDVTVTNCAARYGPGLFAWRPRGRSRGSSCTRCAFINNRAEDAGGAVGVYGTSVSFDRCLFKGNSARFGGAITLMGGSMGAVVNVTRSYFVSNAASNAGGAISIVEYTSDAVMSVRNSVAAYNTAGMEGGALHVDPKSSGSFVLHSVTFLNNEAPSGSAVSASLSGHTQSSVTNSILYSTHWGSALVVNTWYRASVRLASNIIRGYRDTAKCPSTGVCATGTIDADPLLTTVVDTLPDGGPVDTFWVPASGCSPAVKSGDNTGGDAQDMRGGARVMGPNATRGAIEYVQLKRPAVTREPAFTAVSGITLFVNATSGLLSFASNGSECDSLSASLVLPPPASAGTVAVDANGSFVYTPAQGFVGSTTFVFSVSNGAHSAQGTVSITVLPGALVWGLAGGGKWYEGPRGNKNGGMRNQVCGQRFLCQETTSPTCTNPPPLTPPTPTPTPPLIHPLRQAPTRCPLQNPSRTTLSKTRE
jgi:hypothetical protein